VWSYLPDQADSAGTEGDLRPAWGGVNVFFDESKKNFTVK
jgi:hypothetical protein